MSVLEDLQGLEERIVRRLGELRPLVEEYEQLRQVAERLGIDTTPPATPKRRHSSPRKSQAGDARVTAPARRVRRPKPEPAAQPNRRPGGTRATGAERRARVLELIEQRPGITVSEISTELGVDPPPLYRVVRKLQSDGLIDKDGPALRLA